MRIVCKNVEELLVNLKEETVLGGKIDRNVIHLTQYDQPLDKDKHNSVKFQVVVQVSAIVTLPNEDQYLIETAELCGIDYHDATREMVGSKMAKILVSQVKEFADAHDLKVRPGVIDY